MEIEKIHILNVRIPLDISQWISRKMKDEQYSSRSEVVRTMIRNYVRERRK